MAQIELSSLVGLTQSYIAKNYAAALIDKSKTAELKAYIGKYLYDVLVGIADYVIVDCMSLPDSNFLTSVALENADQIIRLSTPDLKCLSFQMSQLKTFASRWYLRENDVAVMNIPREEFNLAAADARLHLGKIAFTVPYCSSLIEQYMEGSLYEPMKDKKFMQTIKAIAERVV